MDNNLEYAKSFSEVTVHLLSALEKELLKTLLRNAYLDGYLDADREFFSNEKDSEEEDKTGRDGLPLRQPSKIEVADSVKAFIEGLNT